MKSLIIFIALSLSLNCFADSADEAKRLLDAMKVQESYANVIEQMSKQYELSLSAQENPFSDPEYREAFMAKIYDGIAKIYSEVYTEDELIAIRQFYESDAGKAFLEKKPLLTEKYIRFQRELMMEEFN